MSRIEAVWQEPSSRPVSADLLRLAGGNPVVAASLDRRGFSNVEQAAAFLNPDLYALSDPNDFPDMDRAVERIIMAIRKKERLAVWGDFDVDGQTSTTILTGGLRALGADAIHHIPVRATESHGVNLPGLQKVISQGASLVVTCDTGITANDAADFCASAGVDFIITDHHSLSTELPAAFALVNPRRLPPGHPAATLSGAGCAWFVLKEITERLGRPHVAEQMLDLAALGLVADLVELTGDCRYLVQRGLEIMRKGERQGLKALAAAAGLELEHATEEHISFVLAPRLNALGRLGDANEMVDFFTTSDPVKAGVVAARLDALNIRRKLLTDQVFTAAVAQVEAGRLERDHPILVMHHPQWPAGILGIAASRLVETYHLPVILLSSPAGEPARGSARSVDGIDINKAIGESAPLLDGFGGHPMAAGMSLAAENIPQFWRELERTILGGTAGSPVPPVLQLDAKLSLPEIDLNLAGQIEILAPFGPGSPPLLFISSDLTISSKRIIGRPGDHLRLTVEDDNGHAQKVMFWNGAGQPLPQGKFDLAYRLSATTYLGEPQVQVEWIAWRQQESQIQTNIPAPGRMQWIDCRASTNPQAELDKIAAIEPPLIWQEGANLSHLPGTDRFGLAASRSFVIWTTPASWNDFQQAVESSNPEKVFLFAVPAEPSRPAELLKRMIGLIQFAIEKYEGWISIEKLAGLIALPVNAVQLAVDLLLSRSIFWLVETDGEKMRFEKGEPSASPESSEFEEDFIRLAAEVNAFRALFRKLTINQISTRIQ